MRWQNTVSTLPPLGNETRPDFIQSVGVEWRECVLLSREASSLVAEIGLSVSCCVGGKELACSVQIILWILQLTTMNCFSHVSWTNDRTDLPAI